MSHDAARWQAPEFGALPPPPPPLPEAPVRVGPSVEELAQIEEAARAEGFAEGKREGLAAGQAEVQRLQQQLAAVLNAFTRPLAAFDAEVADSLGQVALRISEVLLRDAYAAQPERLAQLVDTALSSVADLRVAAEVHLHPTDLALLNQQVDRGEARLLADPHLKRGDVRVHTPILRIDATLESRLQAALAGLDTAPVPP